MYISNKQTKHKALRIYKYEGTLTNKTKVCIYMLKSDKTMLVKFEEVSC